MITYKQAIKDSMEMIAKDPKAVFVGYNLLYGSKIYGTMADIPKDKIYEFPVSEQLMAGVATGLALEGWLPVLIFERMDFMLLAADQIINHLSKIEYLSGGQFNPKVIIRAIVGYNKPFDPGIQHLQNYARFFRSHCSFPVNECTSSYHVTDFYKDALSMSRSRMIIEYRCNY